MKTCTCCLKDLDTSNFRINKSKIFSICRKCENAKNKERREKNLEKYKILAKESRERNKGKDLDKKIAYRNSRKEEKRLYDRKYRSLNAEKIKKQKKDWHNKNKDNPEQKIKRNLRRRIHHLVAKTNKSKHTMEMLGCDIDFFMSYLENKFYGNMTFDNYGSVWHIDHIRPCCSFDLTIKENQYICFHYTNLQPLLKEDNLKKGGKF